MTLISFMAYLWLVWNKKGQLSRLDKLSAIIDAKYKKIKEKN